ncbi:MAG: hypothetical protein ACFFE8_10760 [Candidatus Heimdallarchaeota archaeon]
MSKPQLPLIFQTGRFEYILLPLPLILIPLMGVFTYLNFANDPTLPSPLIPALAGAIFIVIGLLISGWVFLKMKQKLTIDEHQLEITTFMGSPRNFTWDIVTFLEVVFTGKIMVVDSLVDALIEALPSDPLGGAKIKLTSGAQTDSISFMRIHLRQVKQLIDSVISITNIEPTEKQARFKKTTWAWNLQP